MDSNVKETFDPGSTVNFCCLVVIMRDFLKTGDKQYHVITYNRPDTDDCDREYSNLRIRDPFYIYVEQIVDQTKI